MEKGKSNFSADRQSYLRSILLRKDLLENPFDQFQIWFNTALELDRHGANAFALSTVSQNDCPSCRTVLLKEIVSDGFVFYTNLKSSKANHINMNPHVSMLFFWKELERQVRISGIASKYDDLRAEEYFQSRPKGSQIGAWVSKQSQPLKDRKELEHQYKLLEEKYANDEFLPKPPHWGGFVVKPKSFDFWQGRLDRLHDRFRYSLERKNQWSIVRLSP